MPHKLEELANHYTLLIDTSIYGGIQGDYSNELFREGLSGLSNIPTETMQIRLQNIQNINDSLNAIQGRNIFTIKEVIRELKEGLKFQNNYYTLLNNRTKYVEADIRKRTPKIFRKNDSYKKKIGNRKIKLHRDFCDELFELKYLLERRTFIPSRNFNKEEENTYPAFLKMCNDIFEDIRSKDLIKKAEHENPMYLGYNLRTDAKLVATTFTLAYEKPIALISEDKGIKILVGRILGALRSQEDKDFYDISQRPANEIHVFKRNPESYDGSFIYA